MNNENLKQRTRAFALSVIKLVESLPNDRISNVLGNQLLRSGTSVGANYRSAARAKSPADFVAKMGIVEEEADESAYWTDLLEVSGRLKPVMARPLIKSVLENEVTECARPRAQKGGKARDPGIIPCRRTCGRFCARGRAHSAETLPAQGLNSQTGSKEAGELTAIAVASIRTARRNASESKAVPRSAFRTPRST